MDLVKKLINVLSIIRIILSPLVIGSIIGGLLYLYFDRNKTGVFLFEIFTLLGLAFGISWALYIVQKKSATDFITYTSEDNGDKDSQNEK